jgi:hypothetical protein
MQIVTTKTMTMSAEDLKRATKLNVLRVVSASHTVEGGVTMTVQVDETPVDTK